MKWKARVYSNFLLRLWFAGSSFALEGKNKKEFQTGVEEI